MQAKRIAILGLGRSGLAIGRAARAKGAIPLIVDEKALGALSKRDAFDEAQSLGLDVQLEWDGSFDDGRPDILVLNPAVPKVHPRVLQAVADGIEVISEIEFAYRIADAPILAITGTNGKSTTTVMTYLALKACGVPAVLCGNIFGSGYPEQPLTDAALGSTPDQVLVAEVSSFQLEWVSSFRPVSAGITNIWPDHLDRYESFDDYAQTKHRIFAAQRFGDYAVVKANDPVVRAPGSTGTSYRSRHARRTAITPSEGDAPTVLTFGATGEQARVDEQELVLLNERVRLDSLPFDEPHNYVNAAMAGLLAYGALASVAARQPDSHAAALISESLEQELRRRRAGRSVYDGRVDESGLRVLPPQIVEGLRSFHGLAHRMELVGVRDRIRVINNSMCTNPDAVIKSAMAVRDPAHLLIGGVNKGLDFGPLRHYLANRRHRAYLFGSDREELNEMLGGDHPTFRTMEEAFVAAAGAAVGGEVIMLAPGCASTDQFRDFRDRGDVFRSIAKEWLTR